MPLIQLFVLAIIQGITEFIPVSSSAHLILAPIAIESWQDQGPLIDIAAHLGSLFAVFLYFRDETMMLFRGGIDTLLIRESDNRQLFLFIALATIPILIVAGAMVSLDLITALRSPLVIGVASIVFGGLLWHADRSSLSGGSLERLNWRVVLGIGAAQSLAVIPGVSRSGITITAARYFGWSRKESARFSMLLAIPTISAFGLFAGLELISEGSDGGAAAALIVAVLSFISAYLAISIFMKMTERMSFTPFVIYRILLGLALIYLAAMVN
ncbi:MAG: undecaprenyl-diphosphate phosphatase [Marinicaulis sp.]|nr:undecaprenyl-diphosphate phosphatase [Marinicaulis sp.]NNE39328.1 undecaprenyl-diphosphate phosphatase [Marinicaulis sp.]NNL87441.1 undecaprenyl-diphosphate phosphatase [Marinicaulis sp.]